MRTVATGRSAVLTAAIVAALFAALLPAGAFAQDRHGKINEVRISEEGIASIWASILDNEGNAPDLADVEEVEISFGGANTFTTEQVEITTFGEAGRATDYVLIVPGYEGFGVNNAAAALEGAGWFQTAFIGESDTATVRLYGDGVVVHDGNAAELVEVVRDPEAIMRVARPYMLSALEEAVRYFDENSSPSNRRIVVLVGTGLDVQLSTATNVRLAENAAEVDYRRAQQAVLREHERILQEYIDELRSLHIRVYSIGFNETRPDYLEVMEVLARKTGGTYRRVRNIGTLSGAGGDASNGVFARLGIELRNEIILRPGFQVEPAKDYEVELTIRYFDEHDNRILAEVSTRPFFLTTPDRNQRVNLIPYLIVAGIILIVLFLLLLVLLLVNSKTKAKRKVHEEKKQLREVIAAGALHCKTCYRRMEPGWSHCLFCASGMAPLEEKPQAMLDAEAAEERLAELEGRTVGEGQPVQAGTAAAAAILAQQQGKPQCPKCFRVMEREWSQCLFCASGMAPLPQEAPSPVYNTGENAPRPVALY
ncbi:MAG: hypothetical protein KC561_00005, partial [Myxococcales bacterium]|nr:hypothetical protein [Myxococcales bacterium]